MKKNIIKAVLGLSLAMAAFGQTANAKDATVAIVDTKKILENSNLPSALNSAQKEVETFKTESQKILMNRTKQLDDARAKKASDADLKKMQETFQKEIDARNSDGMALEEKKKKELEDLSTKLKSDVEEAIKAVAKEKQIDVVVDKQAVLFGGTDITEDVIKKIKK